MKRSLITRLSVAVIVLMTLCLTSCSKSSIYGKYGSNQNPSDYTELKSDKTFVVQQGSMNTHGTFEVDGTNITLTLGTGQVARGTIDGNTIIDNQGIHWTKK